MINASNVQKKNLGLCQIVGARTGFWRLMNDVQVDTPLWIRYIVFLYHSINKKLAAPNVRPALKLLITVSPVLGRIVFLLTAIVLTDFQSLVLSIAGVS